MIKGFQTRGIFKYRFPNPSLLAGLTIRSASNAAGYLGLYAMALFSLSLFPDPIALAFFIPSVVALWLTIWRSFNGG